MITRFLFTRLSVSNQVKFMKKRGIMLGTRLKNGRQVYTYMFRSIFAEIQFVEDDPTQAAQQLILLPGLDKLNAHLENEIRTRDLARP